MAAYYHLICFDCLEDMVLGKTVCFDKDHKAIPWQFDGAMDTRTNYLDGLERFLLLHRGHEIRVLPEPLAHDLDSEVPLKLVDLLGEPKFQTYVKAPVQPEPDPRAESEAFPTAEAERLWRKIHAPWSLESSPKDERRGFTAKDVERLERQYLASAPIPGGGKEPSGGGTA